MTKLSWFCFGVVAGVIICIGSFEIYMDNPTNLPQEKQTCDDIQRIDGVLYCKNIIMNEDDANE